MPPCFGEDPFSFLFFNSAARHGTIKDISMYEEVSLFFLWHHGGSPGYLNRKASKLGKQRLSGK